MRFARIVLWSALFCATTPLALRAQARRAPRCADGTTAETRYTACWFHGGVVVADSKPAAPTHHVATPTHRVATPLRPASSKAVAASSRKPHEAAPRAKKAAAKAVRTQKAPKGATALCKDATYTDNRNPKKGCKKHDGVARTIAPSGKR